MTTRFSFPMMSLSHSGPISSLSLITLCKHAWCPTQRWGTAAGDCKNPRGQVSKCIHRQYPPSILTPRLADCARCLVPHRPRKETDIASCTPDTISARSRHINTLYRTAATEKPQKWFTQHFKTQDTPKDKTTTPKLARSRETNHSCHLEKRPDTQHGAVQMLLSLVRFKRAS